MEKLRKKRRLKLTCVFELTDERRGCEISP